MEMRGRRMQGWLRVDPEDVRSKRQLAKWADLGTTYARSLPAKKQVLKLQVGCAGHGHLNGHDWQPRVAGNSTPNGNAATPPDSHPGVPRGIAKDRMTVEVEMAGRIDGIANAAG
jgi:hypothetical protein